MLLEQAVIIIHIIPIPTLLHRSASSKMMNDRSAEATDDKFQ